MNTIPKLPRHGNIPLVCLGQATMEMVDEAERAMLWRLANELRRALAARRMRRNHASDYHTTD
jgi:hypothetical protein